MTEEDEAFEELAKRQGYWGMQGSRKHQILRFTENVESKGTSMTQEALKLALEALDDLLYWDNGKPEYDEARKALQVGKQALKEHAMQERGAWQKQLTNAQRNELKQIEDGTWEADRNG